jgi:predicted PurR-regulated permease PerM
VTGSSEAIALAGQLSIMFFVAFFVLTGGAALARRFLGLRGDHAETQQRAQRALLECSRQIRLYVGMLIVTNTALGIAVWAAFALAELPDATGWGVAAAVLHVVPYLGMTVLATLGAAETFLAHQTLGATLGMAAFIVLLSTLLGALVTSWLQGRAARMSPAAVFVGLVFWGALWGVWGLFLGPPLVVLFKVVVEHSRSGHKLARLMQA